MKNNKITYLLFILFVALFIGVRYYGSHLQIQSANSVSSPTPIPSLPAVENTIEPANIAEENYFPDSETIIPDNEDYMGLLNDPWHGDFVPVTDFEGTLPRIVCFGDSMTQTTDEKTAYPDVLRELSACEVMNYGVSSENTSMIAMREGGLPVTTGATVIPAEPELIPIFLDAENGDPIYYLEFGDGGINPCSIDGIEGKISKLNGAYYFKRSEKGSRTVIEDGTLFTTYAMNDKNEEDILILFTGTNDNPSKKNIFDIIKKQRDMIEYYGTSKYLVIGLTFSGTMSDLGTVNEILANEYEDHFLDLRSYLINYGLADAGITPTSTDRDYISKGKIPSSLMRDYVHGNRHFNRLLAEQVYRRLQYLGYLPYNNTEEVEGDSLPTDNSSSGDDNL